jgi:hypothetical protein
MPAGSLFPGQYLVSLSAVSRFSQNVRAKNVD